MLGSFKLFTKSKAHLGVQTSPESEWRKSCQDDRRAGRLAEKIEQRKVLKDIAQRKKDESECLEKEMKEKEALESAESTEDKEMEEQKEDGEHVMVDSAE